MSTPEPTSLLPAGGAAYVQPLTSDPDLAGSDAERAAEWAAALSKRLSARGAEIEKHRAYYDGTQPHRYMTEAWEAAFGHTFGQIRMNWMSMVVDSVVERMEVRGFRLDPTDPDLDDTAWEIWQTNQLDLYSGTLHTDTIVTGWGYVLVWPDADGQPRITVEDPLEVIVMRDPSDRRKVLAGMKRWRDIVGRWHAQLFTPDRVWSLSGGDSGIPADAWEIVRVEGNPVGRVPLVEFVNRPDIRGEGRSDLTDVEPVQDAIDKIAADQMVASEFAAFRQRVLLGAEVPTDEHGVPIAAATFGVARLLAIEGASDGPNKQTPSIQELAAADLSNYTGFIDSLKIDLAARKHVPPQYLLGGLSNVSGDALTAAESGMSFRARYKHLWFGESWEDVIRIAFMILDLAEFVTSSTETVWKDPEITSEATRVDALGKMAVSLGAPKEALWELFGLSQQTIERWRTMAESEAQMQGMQLGISPGSGVPLEPDQGLDESELPIAA